MRVGIFFVYQTFCDEEDSCCVLKIFEDNYEIFDQIFVHLMAVSRKLRRQIHVLILRENYFDPIHLWNSAQFIKMIN